MTDEQQRSRRNSLRAGALGTSGVALAAAAAGADDNAANKKKADRVRFDELLPHEFRTRLAERPIAYLPLGTIEWHGEHIALGADAIQSESLMVECANFPSHARSGHKGLEAPIHAMGRPRMAKSAWKRRSSLSASCSTMPV